MKAPFEDEFQKIKKDVINQQRDCLIQKNRIQACSQASFCPVPT